jgi:hypothetical protein
MALKGRSSAKRTTRWDVLVTNLKPDVPEIPHVADDLKTLEDLLAQARLLQTQQEEMRSQSRNSTDQLKKVLAEGDRLRARLGSTLKGKLGFSDAKLVKYGFTPLQRRRKSKTPTAATGTPAETGPASQGTHPTPPAPAGSHP